MSPPENLPPVLEQIVKERKSFLPDGTRAPLHSNISTDEARLLYRAVRSARPKVGAEVGFAQGISTLAILKAMDDNGFGEHHVMDPFQGQFGDVGLNHVKLAGLDHRLKFYRTFAEETIPGLPRLQFVFIDASHLFDLTVAEFVLADKRLDIGGLIGFHDMWMPSQRKVIRYLLTNRAYRLAPLMNISGEATAGWKGAVSKILRWIPRSERIFRPEILRPWNAMDLPNLVLLEKTGEDKRDWKSHSEF